MTIRPLPDQIPIFPLTGAIVLPKGHLPLNIFEPRYKDMIEFALDNGGILGMIQPAVVNTPKTLEENDNFGTAQKGRKLYQIGCAGLISNFEKTKDNQYFVILTGIKRFEIIEEAPKRYDFREVVVNYKPFINDGMETLNKAVFDQDYFLKILNSYLTFLKINIDLTAFEDVGNEELINSMAMICPFEASEKQLLIEAPTLENRLTLMLKLMEFTLSGYNIAAETVIH